LSLVSQFRGVRTRPHWQIHWQVPGQWPARWLPALAVPGGRSPWETCWAGASRRAATGASSMC